MFLARFRISAIDIRRDGKRIFADGSSELVTVIAGVDGADPPLRVVLDPASPCGVIGLAAAELLGEVINLATCNGRGDWLGRR